MKVLFYEPYASFKPHFATALEIAENHLADGDEVLFVGCDANIYACDVNINHSFAKCLRCKSIKRQGHKLLSKKVQNLDELFLSAEDRNIIKKLKTEFESLDDLKAYRFCGYDIGYSVLSSLIWHYRNPYINVKESGAAKHIKDLIQSAASSYLSIKNYINEHKPDRVYVFNGRLSLLRAVLRYCQSKNIECHVHERGSRYSKYAVYENDMPHSLKLTRDRIIKAWQKEKPEIRQRVGRNFFIDRAGGKQQSWISFTDGQDSNMLPSNWNKKKKNIVIYNSSEDEFAAVGDEWSFKLYKNQLDGINKILESFENETEFHFYLRVHPNLKGVNNDSTKGLFLIKQDNFTLIPPDSPVSTYYLMHQADKILTFGSTAGVEATFWGKVSILLGPSFYKFLDVSYNPTNHEEVVRLIKTELIPKDKNQAIIYGYYMNSFGVDYEHYEPTNFTEGLFKGKPLEKKGIRQMRSLNKGIKKMFGKNE